MRKLAAALVIALVVAVVLGAVVYGNRRAIARAQAEAVTLASQRDSLLAFVAGHRADRAVLVRERAARETAIAALRDSVTAFEQVRARAQLAVRQIRTTGALMDRFRATFPVLGDSAAGLTTVPLEPGDTVGIEYLMVPAWFAETFIIDHANAASWREQRHPLLALDSLNGTVALLQDSIVRLAQAEALAFRAGYDSAYGQYRSLNARYIAELRRPRLRVGSALGFILGAGTGIVVAELIR